MHNWLKGQFIWARFAVIDHWGEINLYDLLESRPTSAEGTIYSWSFAMMTDKFNFFFVSLAKYPSELQVSWAKISASFSEDAKEDLEF